LDPNGKDRAPPTDPKEALKYVEGWTPWLIELIKTTPEMGAVDYKILWRDPDPRWASEHCRIVQIGDAAHSFIPTSAAGASMAMEDGYSLASCLQLGGKQNFALAVKVHNKLRYVTKECCLFEAWLTFDCLINPDLRGLLAPRRLVSRTAKRITRQLLSRPRREPTPSFPW
jgi:hypothetical protein